MASLPSKNNFADIRESADKLISSTKDSSVKRLAGLVGMLSYRCDLLEREVERLERAVKKPAKGPAAEL
jgi:hypothetical protein